MAELIMQGWNFEFYKNDLGSITIEARHKDHPEPIIVDHFKFWPAINAIVQKIDKEIKQ